MDKKKKNGCNEAWEKIRASKEERPLVQVYRGFNELPPIPVSIPQKGAIGETGDWRTYKPEIDQENCINCGQCYLYCPEGTIAWNKKDEIYVIDYIYCKGCGICASECPKNAIEMKLEDK